MNKNELVKNADEWNKFTYFTILLAMSTFLSPEQKRDMFEKFQDYINDKKESSY